MLREILKRNVTHSQGIGPEQIRHIFRHPETCIEMDTRNGSMEWSLEGLGGGAVGSM